MNAKLKFTTESLGLCDNCAAHGRFRQGVLIAKLADTKEALVLPNGQGLTCYKKGGLKYYCGQCHEHAIEAVGYVHKSGFAVRAREEVRYTCHIDTLCEPSS